MNKSVWSKLHEISSFFDKKPLMTKVDAILEDISVAETRDLASDPSTRLFRRAIVIFDGQKNDHDGFVYRRAK